MANLFMYPVEITFLFFPSVQMGRLKLQGCTFVHAAYNCKKEGLLKLDPEMKTILNDISNESELTSFEATVLPRSCFTVATLQQNFLLI